MHIEEHQAGEALGYSILTEESSQVVGSLYLQELSELLDTMQPPRRIAEF